METKRLEAYRALKRAELITKDVDRGTITMTDSNGDFAEYPISSIEGKVVLQLMIEFEYGFGLRSEFDKRKYYKRIIRNDR